MPLRIRVKQKIEESKTTWEGEIACRAQKSKKFSPQREVTSGMFEKKKGVKQQR